MPQITAAAVKELRERTGLPMMECKMALSENDGDQEAAITWLRERGAKTQDARSGRETAFGRAVSPNRRSARADTDSGRERDRRAGGAL